MALSSATATAQNSTTDCHEFGGAVHCYTQTSPPNQGGFWGGLAGGLSDGRDRNGGLAAAIEAHRTHRAERLRAARYSTTGKLIADGKCGDARTLALNEGDFDLVQKVDSACATPASK